jgi:hypothetical protein
MPKFIINTPPVFNGHKTILNVTFFRSENDQEPITQDYEIEGKDKEFILKTLANVCSNLPPSADNTIPDLSVGVLYNVVEGVAFEDKELEIKEGKLTARQVAEEKKEEEAVIPVITKKSSKKK